LLFAAAGVLAAAVWSWRRRLSHSGEAGAADSLTRVREALAAGEPEQAAASAARALREALDVALPGARGRASEELAASAEGDPKTRERVALLGRLDAARFGSDDPELLLALAREAELQLRDR
jgi:hypothetical protein